MRQELAAISADLCESTRQNEYFQINGPDGPLEGAYKIEIDLSDLDTPDNTLTFTLISEDGKRLATYVSDLDQTYLGAAGMRVQATRCWSSLSEYQKNLAHGNTVSVTLHEAYDESRRRYHTYFEDMIDADLTDKGHGYSFGVKRELARQLSTVFLIFTPYFISEYSDKPIVNPWPEVLSTMSAR